MKKLFLTLCAAAALCIGMASCSNEVQDVNVVSTSFSYLYSVSGTVSGTTINETYSYAYVSGGSSVGQSSNFEEYTIDYTLYSAKDVSVNSAYLYFYKLNGKWYSDDACTTDVSSKFTSGTPGSDSFTYKDTNLELTFTKK